MVIDGRTNEQFDEAHIEGALSASSYDTGFATKVSRVAPAGADIVVVAASSGDERDAAQLLASVGLPVRGFLEGGMTAWRTEERPVRRIELIDPDELARRVASEAATAARSSSTSATSPSTRASTSPARSTSPTATSPAGSTSCPATARSRRSAAAASAAASPPRSSSAPASRSSTSARASASGATAATRCRAVPPRQRRPLPERGVESVSPHFADKVMTYSYWLL